MVPSITKTVVAMDRLCSRAQNPRVFANKCPAFHKLFFGTGETTPGKLGSAVGHLFERLPFRPRFLRSAAVGFRSSCCPFVRLLIGLEDLTAVKFLSEGGVYFKAY